MTGEGPGLVALTEFVFAAVYWVCGAAILQKVAVLPVGKPWRWLALVTMATLCLLIYLYFYMPLISEEVNEFFGQADLPLQVPANTIM